MTVLAIHSTPCPRCKGEGPITYYSRGIKFRACFKCLPESPRPRATTHQDLERREPAPRVPVTTLAE